MADELIGWAVAAGVVYTAYKLLFGSTTSGRRAISQESIGQITSMFPHVTAASARWELERNGGSVERAVERALREGGLPEPPASYFPPPPSASDSPAAPRPATPVQATPAAISTSSSSARGPPPSLIQRLGLQSRTAVEANGKGKEVREGKPAGWSTNASEREQNLKARKEKLVLEARRKLLEKERLKKEAAASASSE
ncbi:hypothetical protein JCM8547_005573 [Rhodosporidiobolus lusitaniae]